MALALAQSCSGGGGGQGGDEIRLGIAPAPDSLNPFVGHNTPSQEILGLVLRPLACWDERWRLKPLLLLGVPVEEKRPARKSGALQEDRSFSAVLDMNPRAKWSDGESLESRDFLFTYQMTLMPGARTRENRWAGNVATMAAPSGSRLTVTWRSLSYGENIFNLPIPRHSLQGRLFADPSLLFSPDFLRESAADGPYKLVELTALKARLAPNPGWPGKAPAISRLSYTFFATEDEMVRGLRSGAIDRAFHVPFEFYGELIKDSGTLDVAVTPTNRLKNLCFNLDGKLLANRTVRRALYCALDRKAIVAALFGKAVAPAGTYMPPFSPSVRECLGKADPKRAKRLLEEEGFATLDAEGVRRRGDERLELALTFSWADAQGRRIAPLIKEAWEKVGARVDLESVSPAKYRELILRRGFTGAILTELTLYPWTSLRQLFGKEAIPRAGNRYQGLNISGWAHPDNELLWRRQTSPFDKDMAQGMWKEHQELFAREIPLIPLYFVPEVAAGRKGFSGFRWRGFGEYSWNAEEWSRDGK